MRDPHGRHDAEENSTLLQIAFFFLAVLQSLRLCYALLNSPSRWQRYGNDFVVCVCIGVEEWRRFGSLNHSPARLPHSATQHGQLFDPSSPPFSLCYVLTELLSVIVFLPPERSFLAYAFPLLDMCSLRLSYLYLSSFPISALSTHVLLFLSLMITTITITTFICFHLARRKNKQTYLRTSVLSCPVFCKHINVYRLFWLTVYHPCPS